MRLFLALACVAVLVGCETDLHPVARGEAGDEGRSGEAGRQGQAGQAWRPRTHVVRDSVEVAEGTWDTAMAICDAGSIVMHGGCQWGDYQVDDYTMGNVVPYLSTPTGQGHVKDAFEGWQCQGENVGEGPTRIHVVVTCLEIDTE